MKTETQEIKLPALKCNYSPRWVYKNDMHCPGCGNPMQQFEGKGFFAVVAYCPKCDTYKYEGGK